MGLVLSGPAKLDILATVTPGMFVGGISIGCYRGTSI